MSTKLAPLDGKKQSVTDRLTDPSNYGGTHKNRFGADGKGKGIGGRQDVIANDGNTNSGHKTIDSVTTAGSPQKKSVGAKRNSLNSKPVSMYGTQADTPPTVTVFIMEKNHQGKKIKINRAIRNWKHFMAVMPPLPAGTCRKLVMEDLITSVATLEDLRDGGKYIALPTAKDKIDVDEAAAGADTKFPKAMIEFIVKRKLPPIKLNKAIKAFAKESCSNLDAKVLKACVKQFNIYDFDGSNTMDVNELTSAMVQLGIDKGEHEVQEYMAEMDEDDSGALDIEEFLLVVSKSVADDGASGIGAAVVGSAACVVM